MLWYDRIESTLGTCGDGLQSHCKKSLERIDGVSRTWFEWVDEGAHLVKVLVVEVDFDTDPNSTEFDQSVIDAIRDTANGVLNNETTMIVSH
jgi:hypothetical protein